MQALQLSLLRLAVAATSWEVPDSTNQALTALIPKFLVVTSASLVVTSALLVVTSASLVILGPAAMANQPLEGKTSQLNRLLVTIHSTAAPTAGLNYALDCFP